MYNNNDIRKPFKQETRSNASVSSILRQPGRRARFTMRVAQIGSKLQGVEFTVGTGLFPAFRSVAGGVQTACN